jgi:hypothetical protein
MLHGGRPSKISRNFCNPAPHGPSRPGSSPPPLPAPKSPPSKQTHHRT